MNILLAAPNAASSDAVKWLLGFAIAALIDLGVGLMLLYAKSAIRPGPSLYGLHVKMSTLTCLIFAAANGLMCLAHGWSGYSAVNNAFAADGSLSLQIAWWLTVAMIVVAGAFGLVTIVRRRAYFREARLY